jgi:hypothetical protein
VDDDVAALFVASDGGFYAIGLDGAVRGIAGTVLP